MKEINKNRFEVTTTDLRGLGETIEKCMTSIIKSDYGRYKIEPKEDLNMKLALKIIEGMDEFQRLHNKGVKISGTFDKSLEIYNLEEGEKSIDETMENFIPGGVKNDSSTTR